MARAEESRGLRDEANVGPDPRRARELRPLRDLKWKVADGEPDIRGWSVFASTGRELGVVHDLLVDTEAGEVVMLDVDLKRDDRHTLAPLRAAWIDRGTKRVVVDARELGAADTLPALPREGALSDADMSRFNDEYVRAYGDRGYERDREYRLRRGDDELRFGSRGGDLHSDVVEPRDERDVRDTRGTPRRLLDESTSLGATGGAAMGAAAVGGAHAVSDEGKTINRELADLPRDGRRDVNRDAQLANAVEADAARRERELRDAERRGARLGDEPVEDPMLAEREIDPRELDARVRIDEGATVDEKAPVGGVRYDSPNYPRHSYGTLEEEERADRIDRDERIVSRRPWVDDARETPAERRADEIERNVHYRRADDARP
ncbi:PRC-barrel domain protein [Gemmatirosa kalamazoonensis]|uniref:PRC-barrel domain protein n=1 Tax=Gemmatirosa kalamazoonensis TaxID=861299 RepID=W0R919_9BACT|nr:PRC-barrel domain-containing protein [Gemmatirosa kalamazoonensis]AHG87614.1 PRC-barrel domain protein [Gemmatirosa kalamazoonensis]